MPNKKTIFIPGWMHTVRFYGDYEGLDIWTENINPQEKIEAEYIIAYSIGANFSLLNWEYNKNTKLILVNPLIGNRSFFDWSWRWFQYYLKEGNIPDKNINRKKFILSGIKKAYRILKNDFEKIVKEIPNEKLIIIKGKKDNFYFDDKLCDSLKNNCQLFIEVENAQHNWNEFLKREVDKLI
ncbi:MAG: hypothetical protein NTZ97_03285 [Candidatus Moranbacteria bacterium]|nr:hypothetical protein [Candidatus Moranbacteria bacterium]